MLHYYCTYEVYNNFMYTLKLYYNPKLSQNAYCNLKCTIYTITIILHYYVYITIIQTKSTITWEH